MVDYWNEKGLEKAKEIQRDIENETTISLENCVICLEEIKKNGLPHRASCNECKAANCHQHCIQNWLKVKDKCPNCKSTKGFTHLKALPLAPEPEFLNNA